MDRGKGPRRLDRRTLFGHSFGGLFALFALFRRPELFGIYVAASPALSWEDEALRPFENSFAPSPMDARRRVLLSAGEHEGDDLAPFQRGVPDAAERVREKRRVRTVAPVGALAGRLQTLRGDGLEVITEILAGETHMSVLPAAVNRAVQAAFPALNAGCERRPMSEALASLHCAMKGFFRHSNSPKQPFRNPPQSRRSAS